MERISIIPQAGHVSAEDRAGLLGQKPATIWLTGLSAAGKSTLAFALERELIKSSRACFVLDGDNVRHGLNRDLGFSPQARGENIRRIAEVAKLMNDAGLIVITAFISPFRIDRAMARLIVGEEFFREVYVNTPLDVCEQRDPKKLYQKARKGEVVEFTGISSPYEPPMQPDLVLDTSNLSEGDAIKRLIALLKL